MRLRVVFRRRVVTDVVAASEWYEERRPGAAKELVTQLEKTFRSIQETPEIFAVAYNGVRRAIVSRFPYAVFYVAEKNRIIVLRVLHTARDPKLWPRLKRKHR